MVFNLNNKWRELTSPLLAHMVGTWVCLVGKWCWEDTAGWILVPYCSGFPLHTGPGTGCNLLGSGSPVASLSTLTSWALQLQSQIRNDLPEGKTEMSCFAAASSFSRMRWITSTMQKLENIHLIV